MWASSGSPIGADHFQEGHAHVQPVVCLPKVRRPRVCVHFGGDNFVDSRKRVHDDGVCLHVVEDRFVDDVLTSCLFEILDAVAETLPLNTGLVDDVDLGGDVVEIVFFFKPNAVPGQVLFYVRTHCDNWRRDEDDVRIFEFGEQITQRAHRATIRQISHHGHCDSVHAAKLSFDRVHVEERLSRVLTGPVAGIQDRHRGHGCSPLAGAALEMAQHNDISVAGDDANGVLEGFPFWPLMRTPGRSRWR